MLVGELLAGLVVVGGALADSAAPLAALTLRAQDGREVLDQNEAAAVEQQNDLTLEPHLGRRRHVEVREAALDLVSGESSRPTSNRTRRRCASAQSPRAPCGGRSKFGSMLKSQPFISWYSGCQCLGRGRRKERSRSSHVLGHVEGKRRLALEEYRERRAAPHCDEDHGEAKDPLPAAVEGHQQEVDLHHELGPGAEEATPIAAGGLVVGQSAEAQARPGKSEYMGNKWYKPLWLGRQPSTTSCLL